MKNWILIFTFCFSQIALGQEVVEANEEVSELYQILTEYRADRGSLNRFYFVNGSPERRERMLAFYNSYKEILEIIPFDDLSQNGKVDYLLFKEQLSKNIDGIEKEEGLSKQLEPWFADVNGIYEIEKQRRRGKNLNAQKVATELFEVKRAFEKNSSIFQKNNIKFTKQQFHEAQNTIHGLSRAMENVYEFYQGYDANFDWWVNKPYEEFQAALEDYRLSFQQRIDSLNLPPDDGSGIIGKPIGRQELIRQLKQEMIPYTPEELIRIAEKEFAWCDQELLKASREMGFGEDWKAAQEKVKNTYVPEGMQPERMMEIYEESIAFLKDHDLLTIPPLAEETWRMNMLSPERQLIAPFFLGGETLLIAYPTDEMSHEAKLMSMRGNNPHFARAVLHHEIIAGHHLQQYMNRRNKDYRFFGTPFWTEGWAFYWEMLLWDEGFAERPEDRIGMLFWRMHRCARIIFSLNYHLENWTPQECIDYLVDRVGHERSTAEGEVRRSFTGNYGPLYQIAYMIGGLQFYQLHQELVESGKMTNKEFHDAVLQENSMPVEMLRALLLDQELTKNHQTNWRFYD